MPTPPARETEAQLSARVTGLLGREVVGLLPLGGGDLSTVYAATLRDGDTVVVKPGPHVVAEAEMLAAIRASGCPTPEVVHASGNLMVMQQLASGGVPGSEGWAELGLALRQLHGATGPAYGRECDHAFGPALIPNGRVAEWPLFWAENRLLAWPETLPQKIAARVEHVANRIDELLPAEPPAALLHGDLWSGNVLWTPEGRLSGLIDPASYHGHGEVDLAMLHLFGRPDDALHIAYGTDPAFLQRRAVYQLWPALVHLRLFGRGYLAMVTDLLDRLKA
ncbi:MAG: fructosamine kinase family protein [Celeribacter sp.]|jgi:fructosamine-3-kinase